MMATPGPPYGAILARCRAGARTRGQTSIQDMYHGLGRGGVAVGRVLRNLRGDDVQVRPGGDFDPIGAPSVAAFAHGAGAQHGPRGPYTFVHGERRDRCRQQVQGNAA